MADNRLLDYHVVSLVRDRGIREFFLSVWPYMAMTLSLLVTIQLLNSTLQATASGYVAVLGEPFLASTIVGFLISSFLVALMAGISVASERETGTLEVLFYGPIRHSDYILGKLIAYLLGYLAFQIILFAIYLAFSMMTHLAISFNVLIVMLISAIPGLAMISTGLLASTIIRTTRGAFLLLVGFFMFFFTLQAANVILDGIVTEQAFVGLLFLRDIVGIINNFISWISPVYYVVVVTEAFFRHNLTQVLLFLITSLFYVTLSISLAIWLLRKRGVTQ